MIDVVAVAPVGDPVVADAGLHVVLAHVRAQARAQVLRGQGLADAADVVALAFDGQQRGAADARRLDAAAAPLQFAARQVVALEHALDRLQIELGDAAGRMARMPHIRLDRALQFLLGDRLQ